MYNAYYQNNCRVPAIGELHGVQSRLRLEHCENCAVHLNLRSLFTLNNFGRKLAERKEASARKLAAMAQ